jgi:chromosomal replication initiation ATPase DnaA
MIQAQVTAREIRQNAQDVRNRLRNPPGGRMSSELEIISSPEFRRRSALAEELAAEARRVLAKKVDNAARPIISALQREDEWRRDTPLPMLEVIEAVCQHYDISVVEVRSERRHAYVVRPRHVAMYLARHYTKRSTPSIGRSLGGRDHTTVLSGIQKIEKKLLVDERLAADIDNIKWELGIR